MHSTTAPPSIPTNSSRTLRVTLAVIAAFQFVLGAAFLIAPAATAAMFGLPAAPGWTNWLLAMMAARFLGYGYGMVLAARDPENNLPWIDTMIAIQLVDWIATIGHVLAGDMTLRNVATASFVPTVFVVLLVWHHPRRTSRARSV